MTDEKLTVSQVGEFGLIDRVRSICEEHAAPSSGIGIGDDTAVLTLTGAGTVLSTCDMLVEDVHFRRDWLTPHQLGRRAIAVNLSDIAAMGGTPRQALVSLALPGDFEVDAFEDLFRGMRDEMAAHDGVVAGGNLARTTDKLVIDVFLLGLAESGRVLARSGARPGEGIYVTGRPGIASAGRDILHHHGPEIPAEFLEIVSAQLTPTARVREGRALADSGAVTAMIDISDGLAADLAQLCRESGVGAELEVSALPTPEIVLRVAEMLGANRWRYCLHGGEEYELLFTAPEDRASDLERVQEMTGTPVTRVGTVTPAESGMRLVAPDGTREPLLAKGWDHFGSR